MRDELFYNTPAFVMMQVYSHPGVKEKAFKNYKAALLFVSMIPEAQLSGDEEALDIKTAIVRLSLLGAN